PFIDPTCGSGTIVIEAALQAHNMAPGLFRDEFGFMFWKDFDPELYVEVRREAKAAENINPNLIIQGSDIEEAYIEAAQKNLQNAGLEKLVKLEVKNMRDVKAPEQEGVVVLNPPYGERIGNDAGINDLYKMIGDTLKTNFNGYEAFVFTGNLVAAKHIGLRTSQRIQLYNGPIECRLLKYELYKGSRKQKV
ncbi:MAG: methyltransferase, partial [Hymenobacteraceae bacterium]|nr:methyltransferase [Hymenobacteraceae bacterium]MDX5395702.1 methyltransferase [Hymenobacteraceae bacterium]MDX5511754.1 methyltransferase [Hymenobacteraceae bacterium]